MKSTLKLALVGIASAVTSAAFAQTISVAGPFSFVDTLAGPEAGLNSTATGIAPVTTAYQFGSTATVNTINLQQVLTGSYASEATVRMVNSAYPALSASVNFSTLTTYTTFAITSPTVRNLSANTLNGSNIPVASTWDLTFYETFEDGAGPDSTGDTLSMVPGVYVPPPPKVPWATVVGNTLPIIFDNGTIVNAAGLGFGGADASTIGTPGGTFGLGCAAPNVKLADDFVVPAGGWTVTAISVFAYQTGSTPATSPFSSATIEIWNGNPSLGGTLVATSSTVSDNVFTNVYRVTAVSPFTGNTRPVRRVQSLFSSLSLPAGTYWMTYQMNFASGTSAFSPYVTLGTTQPAAVFPGNAIQSLDAGVTWAGVSDAVAGVQVEVPFLVHGFAPPANQNLTGTLNLGDTGGAFAFNRSIGYTVKQGTSTIGSGTVVASASASSFSISLPASATGAATIEWDGSSFLLRKTNVNLTGSNAAIGSVTMQNGDVDSTGEVDAADIDQVIADFGLMTDIASDVDVSGEVDAADIDIVIANFGGMND